MAYLAYWRFTRATITVSFVEHPSETPRPSYEETHAVTIDLPSTLLAMMQQGTLRPHLEKTARHLLGFSLLLTYPKIVQLPPLTEVETEQALLGELGSHPFFQEKEVAVAFQSLPGHKVFAVAIEQALLNQLVDIFKARRYPLADAIPLPPTLLAQGAEQQSEAITLGCYLANRSLFAILYHQGTPVLTRTLELSEEGEEMGQELEQLITSLTFFIRNEQLGNAIGTIFLLGEGEAVTQPILEKFRALNFPTDSPSLSWIEIPWEEAPPFNFLTPKPPRLSMQLANHPRVRLAAAAILMLFAIYGYLRHQVQEMTKEVRQLESQLVAPSSFYKQLEALETTIQQTEKELEKKKMVLLKVQPFPLHPLLTALQTIMPKAVWLTSFTTQEGGGFEFQGKTTQLQEMKHLLEAFSSLFHSARLSQIGYEKEVISFTIATEGVQEAALREILPPWKDPIREL